MSNFVVDFEDFKACIDEIAEEITLDGKLYDVIIAPARGGLVPATFLSHKLQVPLWPILWSTRDFVRREPLPDELVDFVSDKKNVLIVEDIIDSGKTIEELLVAFRNATGYTEESLNIDTACIVFNPLQDVHQVTYRGIDLPGGSNNQYTDFFWELNK